MSCLQALERFYDATSGWLTTALASPTWIERAVLASE